MLYLPQTMPCIETLRAEGAEVAVYNLSDASRLGAFPPEVKRVLLLNLMPQKAVTELDIARQMVGRPGGVALLPMKIAGQTYKTTPQSHMDALYLDFEAYEQGVYDAMIITGAPLECMPFEQVRYWDALCRIMDWADHHVLRSTLYICWAAQAGLYHHYGIDKYALPAKMFGIFSQEVLQPSCPLFAGLGSFFPMPGSRHTAVAVDAIEKAGLVLGAVSAESGLGVALTADCRRVFITGHLEYEPNTLDNEYRRDVAKGLPIDLPRHYYHNDDPARGVDFSWAQAARRFYGNWLELPESL